MAQTTTSVMTGLVKTAYDKSVALALRSEPLWRNIIDKHPADVDKPGSSVVLSLYSDMAQATSTLTEGVDVTPVALSDVSTVTVTLAEYGNAVQTTEKLALTSFSKIDPAIANMIAWNQVDSIDKVAMDVAKACANRVTSNAGARDASPVNVNTLTASDVYGAALPRYAVAKLRGANVVPWEGSQFMAFIHPDVCHDFRIETGELGWNTPHVYSGATSIFNAEVGTFGGVRYLESPRTPYASEGASSAVVHRTLIFGRDALVEATAKEPGVVIGPETDALRRLYTIGWYGVLGFSLYRTASMYRIDSGSSIS